jgi:hypothetical protein
LLKLKSMNVCTINNRQYQADIADPYWGRDVHIKYDSTERNPQQKYMITLGDHTPLTELEKTYINEINNWGSMVDFSSWDDTKQSLQVNGYYQILNLLTSSTPSFAQEHNTQYAQYETYLRPPAPPLMNQNPYQNMPQQAQQQMPSQQHTLPQPQNSGFGMPYPQQAPYPQQTIQAPQMPQQSVQGGYMGSGQPQSYMQQPQVSQNYVPPPLVTPPNMAGLTHVDMPFQPTPVPTNVPPPLGYSQTIPVQEGEIEIPFDGPERTYPLKGRQVSKDEFSTYVNSFASSLARGNPVQVAKSGELAGATVPACYGDYQGDTSCLKCPLRLYCVHV